MKVYKDIGGTVGNTPLVKLKSFGDNAEIYGKLEFFNPSSSVKDRIAFSMIEAAENDGRLKPGGTIIEPTSGNTGLGLAVAAAAKGYKLIICMPETMSIERQVILEHLGAEIVLTSGDLGMKGAVQKAEELISEQSDAFMPQQFKNPANPEAHEKGTAVEIWNDTDGKVDIFVAGVGTGGTVTGVGKFLKEKKKSVQVVAVEPESSAVLSGEPAGKHKIQGIGAGFIPDILDRGMIDRVVKISDEDSFDYAGKLAAQEGILCGISSGALVKAASDIAAEPENRGKTVVVIICDTAERYLSTKLMK